MDRAELVAKIRKRIEMCRKLASSTTDPRTATELRTIADEGERDLERLTREG